MVDKRSIQISVLAHASILIGFVFRYSFIFPLLIWKTMKHSKYSEFQAMQAAYYQMATLLAIIIISFAAALALPSSSDLLIKEVELGVYTLLSLYALYGAYKCSRGEEFRYMLVGNL